MFNFKKVFVAIMLTLLSSPLAKAEGVKDAILYIGGGKAATATATKDGSTPLSIGYLTRNKNVLFGFDFGREGTLLDSTYRQNSAPTSALSLNFIIGTNLFKQEKSSFDAGIILGIRQSTKDCPDSFIGYACYADQDPKVDFKENLGVIAIYSFEKFSFGARVTQASTQFIIGTRF